MTSGVPKKSRTCGQAAGILSARLRGWGKKLPRQQVRRAQSMKIPQPAQGVPLGPGSLSVPAMSEVTRILSAIEQGEPHAAAQLLPPVYEELRKLARQRLAQEKPGQTLQATALVHEAYLRLVDTASVTQWKSRGHFFAAAAEAMRRILVENARRKGRAKHGGKWKRLELDAQQLPVPLPAEGMLALDE